MKAQFSFEKERFLLLTAVFILLAGTITLCYLHPHKNDVDSSIKNSYESGIKQKWYDQTRGLLSRQEWQNARICANKILLNFPGDIFARRAIARATMEQKNFALSENICRKLIAETPEDAVSRNNLAVLLHHKFPQQSLAEITIARNLMPEHPAIKYNYQLISDINSGSKVSVTPPDQTPEPEIFILSLPKEATAL